MATNRLALQSPDPANRLPYWPEADVQEPNVCLSGSSRRHAKFYARVRTAIRRKKVWTEALHLLDNPRDGRRELHHRMSADAVAVGTIWHD